jgi:hypothetical protein
MTPRRSLKIGQDDAARTLDLPAIAPLGSPAVVAGKRSSAGSARGAGQSVATEPGRHVVEQQVAATEPGRDGREEGLAGS